MPPAPPPRRHILSLVWRPAGYLVLLFCFGLAAQVISSKQAERAGYFKVAAAIAFLACVPYALEIVALLPIVANCARNKRSKVAAHNDQVKVECMVHPTNLTVPSNFRHISVRLLQCLSLILAIVGAAVFSFKITDQRIVSGIVAITAVIFLVFFLVLLGA
jgi:hypothetical protein